jgi:cytochrome c biogenesis protein CcdA/thiol-disulfide isomerase/thioredoxin
MLILVPIAFAAGVITAFTPCILPVLPIVLAGGGTGTQRRPYAIAAGLVTTFTALLLAGAWLWGLLGISAKHQIRIGAALLLVLAVILIFPKAGELAERPFLFLTRRRAADLGGGFLLGASLGLVFVPCGGPVLATLTANVATDRVGGWIVVIAIAYALGAALPMLAIARGSQGLAARFRRHAPTVRIAGGVLMGASALVIYQGWAQSLQTNVPGYAGWIQDRIEGSSAAHARLDRLAGNRKSVLVHTTRLSSRLDKVPLRDYGAAPNVDNISAWINSRPLTLRSLRGKVVLVDFWTYSCINCLRTLPHLKSWDERYRSKGLVILGIHTPEFAFEHDLGNVRAAVKRLGVRYPVALDNDYGTWNAYGNQYWPAEYLVDQSGHVRDVHFGEGNYSETDHDIRLLLAAGAKRRLPKDQPEPDRTPTEARTPETYLGYLRIGNYAGSPLKTDRTATYAFPSALGQDAFAYAGTWRVEGERIVAGPDARLRLRYLAQNVHLVLAGHGTVHVKVDGRPTAKVEVDADRLYTLASSDRTRKGLLALSFTPGLSAYAFTFG